MNINIRPPDADEEKRKKICLEQLAADRQELLMKWPFIGGIIMRMELIAVRDDRLETACTDGSNIFVDINFYSELNRNERLFVLAHEVWHSVFLHFVRKQNRNQKLFNAAADLEIHFALKDENMRAPWVLPHQEIWQGLSAEEIYEKLLKDPNYKGFGGENSDDSDNSVKSGSGMSSDPGKDKNDSSNSKKSNGKSFDKHIYEEDSSGISVAGGGSAAQSAENSKAAGSSSDAEFVIDNDYAPKIKPDAAEQIRGRVIAAAQQVERMKGDLPGNIKKLLDSLMTPSLPWQELLKQFVSTCYGGKRRWLPPARRHVWHDLYLPSMRDERINAVVAIDTSGSTSNDLPRFFSELVGLMKSFGRYEITLIQCDAAIQSVEKFSDANQLPPDKKFDVKGFAGTDFRPVFQHVKQLEKQPELLIYITDGFGNAPDTPPPYPVLWVLTADGKTPASWGKSIFLDNNQKGKKYQ